MLAGLVNLNETTFWELTPIEEVEMTDNNLSAILADEDAIQRTVAALNARNIETTLVNSGEIAKDLLIGMVPEGAELFNNTSETLDAIGYTEFLNNTNKYNDLHKSLMAEQNPDRQRELRRLASVAEYVLGSVQAIAETGEVLVASSSGSQLGAYVYGAKYVILVAGTQKICSTLEDALARVRGYSLTRHKDWQVGQGRSPRPIGKLMLLENEITPGRIKMVLIKENLGW